MSENDTVVLLFDIGGTNMRMAYAREGAAVELVIEPTPNDPLSAIALLERYVHQKGITPTCIAGGVAGIVRDGVIIDSPHLRAWNDAPLAQMLAHAFSVPAHLENDAACEALGEATHGAGKGYDLVGYLTIGTGVGGALTADGILVPHHDGFEPGRMILDSETGKTLEDFVGGAALREETGMHTHDLLLPFYDERAQLLAVGIANLIDAWSPDVFVLGGSLMNDVSGFRIPVIEQHLTVLMPERTLPLLTHAALGDFAGLQGALTFAESLRA